MKHPAVLASVIISIGLIICTLSISSAISSLGQSLRDAASAQRIPSNITLSTPDLRPPLQSTLTLKLDNGGGGGEYFRVKLDQEGG